MVSFVAPLQWPAWSGSIKYDGTYSTETNCSNPNQDVIVQEWKVHESGTHTAVLDAELRHSPHCDTSWVRAKTLRAGITVTKEIRRPAGFLVLPTSWEIVTDQPTTLWTYGYQVYAPGCVDTKIVAKLGSKVVGTSTRLCSNTP